MSNPIQRLSLSVEELAMAFCLINQAETGQSFLQTAFGNLSATSMEDRLTSASHSLLARELVRISEKGTAVLQEQLELLLYPLIKFNNLLQVTLNPEDGSGPTILNMYLGPRGAFTALRAHTGVVYELAHSTFGDAAQVVQETLRLPADLDVEVRPQKNVSIELGDLAAMVTGQSKSRASELMQAGLPKDMADGLAKDIESARVRGSVVLTGISSENFASKNVNDGGPGFLFLLGSRSGWLFKFENTSDETPAEILPCTKEVLEIEVSKLVNRGANKL